jgi:hypothetical protein
VGGAHVAALARVDPAAAGEGQGTRKSRCKSRAGCDVIIKMIQKIIRRKIQFKWHLYRKAGATSINEERLDE